MCGCCIKDLKIENGVLKMLKGGKWETVTGGTIPPSFDTIDDEVVPPDSEPVQGYRCTKADTITKAISSLGLSAFDIAENNPTASLSEKANLLSIETGMSLIAQYAVQVFQMIDAEEAIITDFDAPVVTTIKKSLYNILGNSMDMADVSMNAIANAISGSDATTGQKAAWSSAMRPIYESLLRNKVSGAIQAGEGDCTDMAQSLFPDAFDAVFFCGFETGEESKFNCLVGSANTDEHHTGSKSGGWFANFPATSVSNPIEFNIPNGLSGSISFWAKSVCSNNETRNAEIIIFGKKQGDVEWTELYSNVGNWDSIVDNTWTQFSKEFTRDTWRTIKLVVNHGSTVAIGSYVDDVTIS